MIVLEDRYAQREREKTLDRVTAHVVRAQPGFCYMVFVQPRDQ